MTIAARSGALTDVTFLPIEGQQGVYQFASDFNLTLTMENPFRTGAVLYIEFEEYLTSKTDFALMTDQYCTLTSEDITISSDSVCQVFSSQKLISISNVSIRYVG